MPMEQILHAAVLAALGAAVALLGHWGRSRAVTLVPDHLEVFDREKRIRSLQRGGLACFAASAVMVGAAVLAVV